MKKMAILTLNTFFFVQKKLLTLDYLKNDHFRQKIIIITENGDNMFSNIVPSSEPRTLDTIVTGIRFMLVTSAP
jgi:hypothetical protein